MKSNKKTNSYSLINVCFFFSIDFFFDTSSLYGPVNIQPLITCCQAHSNLSAVDFS